MKKTNLPECGKDAKIRLRYAALIAAVVFVVYSNSLKNDFVYDDSSNIVENEFIRSLKNLPRIFSSDYFVLAQEKTYRPVVTASYFLDHRLFGLKPAGWRATNVLFHALNGILLYAFGLCMGLGEAPALVAALFFCLHPVQAEVINVISFREDPVSFSFFLMAILLYLKSTRGERAGKATYLLSIIIYFFAVFSKEMALTLPFVLMAYDYYFRNRGKGGLLKSVFGKKMPFYLGYLAVAAFYFVQKVWLLKPAGQVMRSDLSEKTAYLGGSIAATAFTMIRTAVYYLEVLVLPLKLTISRAFEGSRVLDSRVVFSALIIGALCAGAFAVNRSSKKMGFSILFFFLTFLPVSNIIPIGAAYAERYLYLPSFGFCLLLALGLERLNEKNFKKTAVAAMSVIMIFYSVRIFLRNGDFRDEFTLWSRTIATNPDSDKALNNRGIIYAERGEYGKAIEDFTKALQIRPGIYEAYNNRGKAYALGGEPGKAEADFRKALEIKPGYEPALINLRIIQGGKQDIFGAKEHLAKGLGLMEKGLLDEAIREYDAAIKLAPDYSEGYNKRGIAHGLKNNLKKAVADFSTAILLNPADYMAYANRSIAYRMLGEKVLSEKDAGKAASLKASAQ